MKPKKQLKISKLQHSTKLTKIHDCLKIFVVDEIASKLKVAGRYDHLLYNVYKAAYITITKSIYDEA